VEDVELTVEDGMGEGPDDDVEKVGGDVGGKADVSSDMGCDVSLTPIRGKNDVVDDDVDVF